MESFRVYVDESGDEGFEFRRGSSEWFVLSAVVLRTGTELATVKLVDDVRALLKKPERKPLHFRDLRHKHRVPYAKAIAAADLRAVSVLVHKPSLHEPETFRERFRLYFYTVRYLLERVSWYCRDRRTTEGDGTAAIVFSNRSGMHYGELCEYLRRLEAKSKVDDIRIHWPAIRADQVTALSSGKRMGLQIADAVASSFWYAAEVDQYGNNEDKYAAILKPVMYSYGGKYSSYGVKLWPKEVVASAASMPNLSWVRAHYTP